MRRAALMGLVVWATALQLVVAEKAPFPGEKTMWRGYDMYSESARKIVVPKKVAEGKPWVWRARFWGHWPYFDDAMLAKGYHVVYCNVAGLLGNEEAVTRWNKFYDDMTREHGLARKPILEGMSRGGMIIYNWAIANPDKVAAIYGDAPVMDIKSWPGWGSKLLSRAYVFKTEEDLNAYKGCPVDNLEPLAKAGVPIFHVVGDKDNVVPVAENTAVAEKRYQAMGGVFEVIHKENIGHKHGLPDNDPRLLVEFIEKHVEKTSKEP